MVEFVIDTTGRVQPHTIRILTSTHQDFADGRAHSGSKGHLPPRAPERPRRSATHPAIDPVRDSPLIPAGHLLPAGGDHRRPLALRNRRPVAGGAHRRVLAPQRSRIEAGTVRVESPAAHGRVAGQAVALGVAGDAALQILACRLTVIEQEGLLGVVIAAVSKLAGRDEAGVQVAVGAELPLVVAVAAGALPAVGRGRVTGEEARRVVARRRGSRVRPVAGQAGRTGVACAAALGTGRGRLGVQLGKIEPVRGGPLAVDRRSGPPRRGRRRGPTAHWQESRCDRRRSSPGYGTPRISRLLCVPGRRGGGGSGGRHDPAALPAPP